MLKRSIWNKLLSWKNSPHHPLILAGLRQTGKTYIVREFGKENYENVVYLDMRKEVRFHSIFEGDFDIDTMVTAITANEPSAHFVPGKTLLILDEIQDCPDARSSLKYWDIDGRYDVIATGSFLGVRGFRTPYKRGIPVGYEQRLEMYPLSFAEFLENAGNTYNKLLNKVMGLSSAPSVIACVGKDNNSLDQRVGYYGEKLVLLAQKLGLNTCWAGTFNRKNINAEVNDGERLVISIAIGYGKNQGKQHKSKSAEDVTEVEGTRPEWFDNGVEMALLAPTAVNQQKFVIKLRSDETVEFINNAGMLGEVDLGIVRYHFEVGSGISQIPAE